MSQIAALTAANAIAQLTLPLIERAVLPQQKGQASTTPSLNITDTVSISSKASSLQQTSK